MIVNKLVARELLEIFEELFLSKFPIYQIKLIDYYDSDDEKSMSDNNSHCFRITDGYFTATRRMWHGLGLAVDINPLCNPCIYLEANEGEPKYVPANSGKYLDRNFSYVGMINPDPGNACYSAFIKRGWEWGGNWIGTKDLHHFQKFPRDTLIPRKYEVQNLEKI